MNRSFWSHITPFGGNVMLSFCGNYRWLRITSAKGFELFSCVARSPPFGVGWAELLKWRKPTFSLYEAHKN